MNSGSSIIAENPLLYQYKMKFILGLNVRFSGSAQCRAIGLDLFWLRVALVILVAILSIDF
jgi:hypothetical protein